MTHDKETDECSLALWTNQPAKLNAQKSPEVTFSKCQHNYTWGSVCQIIYHYVWWRHQAFGFPSIQYSWVQWYHSADLCVPEELGRGQERSPSLGVQAHAMHFLSQQWMQVLSRADIWIRYTPQDDEWDWEALGGFRRWGWGPVSASTMQGSGTGPAHCHGFQESYGDGAQNHFACVALLFLSQIVSLSARSHHCKEYSVYHYCPCWYFSGCSTPNPHLLVSITCTSSFSASVHLWIPLRSTSGRLPRSTSGCFP